MRPSITLSKILLGALLLVMPAVGGPILVHQYPWGLDNTGIMTTVFGAGNFDVFDNSSTADPAAVFAPSNRFVWLDAGESTDAVWNQYINDNNEAILDWVAQGGALLLNFAGFTDLLTTTLGPGSLTSRLDEFDLNGLLVTPGTANDCGTLTPAGQTAFPNASLTTCGFSLAQNVVSGALLTTYVVGNTTGTPIVAGASFGFGYVMYSGLTNSLFHDNSLLVEDVARFTADQATDTPLPEPGTWMLLGAGLGVVLASRRLRA